MSQPPSAKLTAARELIQVKDYAAARVLLRTLPNDPTAIKWLTKLDEIAPEPIPHVLPSEDKGTSWLVFGAMSIVLAVCIVAILGLGLDRVRIAPTLAAAQTVQAVIAAFSATRPPPLYTDTPFLFATPGVELGNWLVSTEVSKLDGTLTVMANLHDDTYSPENMSFGTGNIQIKCVGDNLSMFFNGDPLNTYISLSIENNATFRYKFDDEPVQTISVASDYSKTAFAFPDTGAMLKDMRSHGSLTIGFTPYSGVQKESTFTLAYLGAALQPMHGHCGQ